MTSRYLDLYPSGFHGDTIFQSLVDVISARSTVFIETGTNSGSTLTHVARTYPHLRCYSCEPDKEAYAAAARHLAEFPAVELRNATSQQFLPGVLDEIKGEVPLFWLDAHGWGFEWPLRFEVETITRALDSAYILIDDFRVPHLPQFEFDKTDDYECSFEHIASALNPARAYTLVYPNYTERTSKHHPLCGWGLLCFGPRAPLELDAKLRTQFLVETRRAT